MKQVGWRKKLMSNPPSQHLVIKAVNRADLVPGDRYYESHRTVTLMPSGTVFVEDEQYAFNDLVEEVIELRSNEIDSDAQELRIKSLENDLRRQVAFLMELRTVANTVSFDDMAKRHGVEIPSGN